MNQNTERQPKASCSQPPRMGAIAGASANISIICDITRCAMLPAKLSRMMARPTTIPPLADKPCAMRHNNNACAFGAMAQPMELTT